MPDQNIPTVPVQPVVTPAVDPLLTSKTVAEDIDARWVSWKCMVCNYVYEGDHQVDTCPRCGNNDPDKFD